MLRQKEKSVIKQILGKYILEVVGKTKKQLYILLKMLAEEGEENTFWFVSTPFQSSGGKTQQSLVG